MHFSPLYISFGQHQVMVETTIVDIHATLQRWFYAMLEPQPSSIVHRVTIWQEAENYIMQSGEIVHDAIAEQLYLLQAVKYEVVMGLVNVRPDLLWFHAGAVAMNERGAVVFAAPGGSGKSTLVAQLYQQGWHYLSDDLLPLDLATGNILPFPQTPRVRQNTGQLVPIDRLAEVPKFDVALNFDSICRSPLPIQAIVFPCFDRLSSAQIFSCSPGSAALELLRNCINFTSHKQAALRQVSEIVKHLPAFKLSFSDIDRAIECLDRVDLISSPALLDRGMIYRPPLRRRASFE
jgi:hypothetical protein